MDKRTRHYHRTKKVIKQWLTILVVIIALTYISQPVQIPVSPCPESGCVVEYISKVHAAEPIVEAPKPSKKVEACVKKHPYVSEKIEKMFDDSFNAKELICRESSFNPTIINSSSGACGLAQALPCSKMKCDLADIDCQLKWIGDYVNNRYGSFENAIKFHNENNWY